MTRAFRLLVALALTALPTASIASVLPITVPFDFSRHVIGLNVIVRDARLFMLLDTGVEPSIVSLATAKALNLPMDRSQASQGSGFGSGKAVAYPATIDHLRIGREFGDVEAMTLDTSATSKRYGRSIDGVLGDSFLKDKTVLIDYRASTITLLADSKQADALTRQCRKHFSIPLLFLGDNHWPVIAEFRIGAVTAPATLDTGSSRSIGFFQTALQMKGLRDALKVVGTNIGASVGGSFTSSTAVLGVPVGFGPFSLPAGETVSLLPTNGQSDKVVANIGNQAFAELTPKLLLDYAGKRISFFADCVR